MFLGHVQPLAGEASSSKHGPLPGYENARAKPQEIQEGVPKATEDEASNGHAARKWDFDVTKLDKTVSKPQTNLETHQNDGTTHAVAHS